VWESLKRYSGGSRVLVDLFVEDHWQTRGMLGRLLVVDVSGGSLAGGVVGRGTLRSRIFDDADCDVQGKKSWRR
jgi:hypothetical protein